MAIGPRFHHCVCQHHQALLLLIRKAALHELMGVVVVVEVRLLLSLRHPIHDAVHVRGVLLRLCGHKRRRYPSVGTHVLEFVPTHALVAQYGEALREFGHVPSPTGFRSLQTLRKVAARVD